MCIECAPNALMGPPPRDPLFKALLSTGEAAASEIVHAQGPPRNPNDSTTYRDVAVLLRRFGHVRVTEGRQPHPNQLSEVIRSGVVKAHPCEQMSGIDRPQRKRAFLSLFHCVAPPVPDTSDTPNVFDFICIHTFRFQSQKCNSRVGMASFQKPAYPPRLTGPRNSQPWKLAHRPPEGPAGRHINGDGSGPPR